MEIGTKLSGKYKRYQNCGPRVCTFPLFLMEAIYTSENRDPWEVARSFPSLRSVGVRPPQQCSPCGAAGGGRGGPGDPAGGTSRPGDLGEVLPASRSPAPREQHPPGRRAAHAGLPPYLEKRAGTKPATLLGCCYKPRRRFAGRSRCGARQSRSRLRPAPRDRAAPCRAVPGGEGRPGLCKVAAPPVVRLRLRAQPPLPRIAPRGESTGRLLSVVFLESLSARRANQPARGNQPLLRVPSGPGRCVAALLEKSLPCVKKRVVTALPTATGKRMYFGSCPCPALSLCETLCGMLRQSSAICAHPSRQAQRGGKGSPRMEDACCSQELPRGT
ncbi:uncharacterized protein LOC130152608 [Falco biarmicus]|uniref:uncharacterized protein LOC130152608 n=1 Tax=Falco biarmicus TaxID=345155 RepID=UPI0024BD258C|nr:uncharacterized protein LOC130152608 [Falco biarmicus]XP_056202454.1 uncharacterized protein LOC130152608 [Falco biarmicus]XP_056202455.1 uncharacterized protein LOC130152608 [Falco biarmicus]